MNRIYLLIVALSLGILACMSVLMGIRLDKCADNVEALKSARYIDRSFYGQDIFLERIYVSGDQAVLALNFKNLSTADFFNENSTSRKKFVDFVTGINTDIKRAIGRTPRTRIFFCQDNKNPIMWSDNQWIVSTHDTLKTSFKGD